jgi:excisionase family DNA binding protein
MFTVKEVAKRYRVSPTTVLQWIADGALKALRTNRRLQPGKVHYRITQAHLDSFEQARTCGTPTPPTPRTPRRKQEPIGTTKYYPE